MNSTLKVAVPLVLFVAVIFGLTIIATHTPPTPTTGPAGGDDDAPIGPALNFASTKMRYSPDSDDISMRYFPGVFELSDVPVPVSFWFQNPHKVPVQVSAMYRSCAACSAARVITFRPDAMKSFQLRAAASLPLGAAGPPNLLLPLALTELLETADRKDLDFEHPDAVQEVPPRAADGFPTWGILQLGIQVKALGGSQKTVGFGLTPGSGVQQRIGFEIAIAGVYPFLLYPEELKLGEFEEGAPPRPFTVYYWTGTREPADLPEPVLGGFDPKDPFLVVSKPVAMTAAERAAFSGQLANLGKTLRVSAGYQFTVTVYRRREGLAGGPVEPDIGPFGRTIDVTGRGLGHSVQLPLTGTVVGLVGLTDRQTKVDVGSFRGDSGTEKVVTLASLGSDASDLTLEVDREKTHPKLRAALEPAPAQGPRKFWTLTVTVPPGHQGDLPPDCAFVLRAKTKEGPRLIRIPVIGRGTQR